MSWKGAEGLNQSKWILSEAPLTEIRKAAEDLSSLVCSCVGPAGHAVLVNDSGRIYITKTGIEVLKIYDQCKLPARDFIIQCAKDLNREVGDGVKTFIVMLYSLLNQSDKIHHDSLVQLKELSLALRKVSNNFVSTDEDYCTLSKTFFNTRFSAQVSKTLSSLFNEWINKYEHNTITNESVIDYLLKHFDSLVVLKEESVPFSDSKVARGITFTGNYYGKLPKTGEKFKLVGFYLSEENSDNEEEINTHLRRLLFELSNYESSDILLVTNCKFPSKSLQLLNKYKLITHVQCSLALLVYEYSIRYKNENCIYPDVEFSFLNTFKKILFIDLPLHSLFLYTANKTFSSSYSEALKSCLKLYRYSIINKTPLIECGKFEQLFSIHFAGSFSNNFLIPLIPKTLLETWSEKMKEIKMNFDDVDTCTYVERNDLENIVYKIIKCIKNLKLHFNEDVVEVFCQMLLDFSMKIPALEVKGFEPLHLKFLIISNVLNTFCTIINIDKIVKVRNISELKFHDLDIS